MSLSILYHFPVSCSNVLTSYDIFCACFPSVSFKMLTCANSLMAKSTTRSNLLNGYEINIIKTVHKTGHVSKNKETNALKFKGM